MARWQDVVCAVCHCDPRCALISAWGSFVLFVRTHIDVSGSNGGTNGSPRTNHHEIRTDMKVISDDDVHDVSVTCLRKRAWWNASATIQRS
jgi:hypothetical protein